MGRTFDHAGATEVIEVYFSGYVFMCVCVCVCECNAFAKSIFSTHDVELGVAIKYTTTWAFGLNIIPSSPQSRQLISP